MWPEVSRTADDDESRRLTSNNYLVERLRHSLSARSGFPSSSVFVMWSEPKLELREHAPTMGRTSDGSELVMMDDRIVEAAARSQPAVNNLNVTKSSRVHIGPKFVSITQNVDNTEVVKGQLLITSKQSCMFVLSLSDINIFMACELFIMCVHATTLMAIISMQSNVVCIDISF